MFMQTGAPELLPLMHKISRSHSFYCRSSAGTDHWQKMNCKGAPDFELPIYFGRKYPLIECDVRTQIWT